MIFEHSIDNVTEEDIKVLDAYFRGYDYDSSAHTFLANYAWRKGFEMSWQIIGDYLLMESSGIIPSEEERHYLGFPLTRTGGYDAESLRYSIDTAREIFMKKGLRFEMGIVPVKLTHWLKEIYGDEIVIEHDREDDDYIYDRESLETLKGRKLHTKKNHLNYFLNNTDFLYEEALPGIRDEIMHYIVSKNEFKLGETPDEWKEVLEDETIAASEMLDFLGERIFGGVIRIGGRIEAVELAEFADPATKETVIVHIEKADDRIRGLYQAINNEFVKRLPPETRFVNREEDMGMENLRQAKEGYRPCRMGEKCSAWFRKDWA